MQRLPGSQLCSGHEQGEEQDVLVARWKHKNHCQGLSCRGLLGVEGHGDPNKMQKGAISSDLPRETTADLLGMCQQVLQITTSVAEEDVLVRKGLVTKRPMCSKWQTT